MFRSIASKKDIYAISWIIKSLSSDFLYISNILKNQFKKLEVKVISYYFNKLILYMFVPFKNIVVLLYTCHKNGFNPQ